MHWFISYDILQEVASLENDSEMTRECQSQLDELEERAKELDQRRTNNISAIRFMSPLNCCHLVKLIS